MAWFGNQFYVAGGGGTILRSPNGVAWSKVPTPSTAYLSGLEVFPGGLVAVGNQGTILTSPNGANWTVQTSGTTNWLLRVHYLGGRLFAVGDNGTILTSANGAAWQAQTSGVGVFLNDLAQVARALYVGTAGDLNVDLVDGSTVVFPSVLGGAILPVRVKRVRSSSTTASNSVALY